MKTLELTGMITALANAIAYKLSGDEIALLSSILVQLGDTLATVAAGRILCNGSSTSEG